MLSFTKRLSFAAAIVLALTSAHAKASTPFENPQTLTEPPFANFIGDQGGPNGSGDDTEAGEYVRDPSKLIADGLVYGGDNGDSGIDGQSALSEFIAAMGVSDLSGPPIMGALLVAPEPAGGPSDGGGDPNTRPIQPPMGTPAAVPEPATCALLTLAALSQIARRKRAAVSRK